MSQARRGGLGEAAARDVRLSRRLLADQMRAWPVALSSATACCKATARAKSGGIRATWPWLPRRYDGYPLELLCLYTVLPIAEGNGQG